MGDYILDNFGKWFFGGHVFYRGMNANSRSSRSLNKCPPVYYNKCLFLTVICADSNGILDVFKGKKGACPFFALKYIKNSIRFGILNCQK